MALESELAGLHASLSHGFGRYVWLKAVMVGLQAQGNVPEIEEPVPYRVSGWVGRRGLLLLLVAGADDRGPNRC